MNEKIRKLFIIGLFLMPMVGLYPVSAMENPQVNIGDITPVRDGMSKEEAKTAILNFLKNEVLKPENEINERDIIVNTEKKFGTRGEPVKFIILRDKTEWVGSKDGLQRFLGAHYLQKALEFHQLSTRWHAVQTKFIVKNTGQTITVKVKKSQDKPLINIFTINSDDFITFSQYVGDHRATNEDLLKIGLDFGSKYEILYNCDYADLRDNANLRIAPGDNKVTVIDTEYSSFTNEKKVLPPSQQTDAELGGISFTFSKAELGLR